MIGIYPAVQKTPYSVAGTTSLVENGVFKNKVIDEQ